MVQYDEDDSINDNLQGASTKLSINHEKKVGNAATS